MNRGEMRRGRVVAARVAAAALLVGLAGGLAGCGSSGSATASNTTTSAPATTVAQPTTTLSQEAQDKAEIEALFSEWYEVFGSLKQTTNDWEDPRLAELATGDTLAWAREHLKERSFRGEISRKPANSQAHFEILDIRIEGGVADVDFCEVNDVILETRDGVVLNDDVVTRFDSARVERRDGRWKLAEVVGGERREGKVSCEG